MAGSSLPVENYYTTHSENLNFTFDFEGNYSNLTYHIQDSSSIFQGALLGDIEFIAAKRFTVWKSIGILCLMAVVCTLSFYFFNIDKKEVLAANLAVAPKLEKHHSIEKANNLASAMKAINIVESERKGIQKIVSETVAPAEKISSPKEMEVNMEPQTPQLSILKPKNSQPKGYKTKSLAKARKMSHKTGRYIFIKFGADWCVPCQLMENTAMIDEKVVGLLDEKFIVLDIDVAKAAGAKIKEEFYVEKLPTLIILDDLGNQMKRHEGGLGTSALIEMLESVVPYIYLEEEELVAHSEEENLIRGE